MRGSLRTISCTALGCFGLAAAGCGAPCAEAQGSGATLSSPAADFLREQMDRNQDFFVYRQGDDTRNRYSPSGSFGDHGCLKIDYNATQAARPGEQTSLRIEYSGLCKEALGFGYAGIYFQDPKDNWGDVELAGFDLSGAAALELMARAESDTARIEVKVGGLGYNLETGEKASHPDSMLARSSGPIALTTTWEKHSIPLCDATLSRIAGGFVVVFKAEDLPDEDADTPGVAVHLDDVRFVFHETPAPHPHLPESYVPDRTVADDVYVDDRSETYDVALAILALLSEPSPEAEARQYARAMVDALVYAYKHDPVGSAIWPPSQSPDHALRNSYHASFLGSGGVAWPWNGPLDFEAEVEMGDPYGPGTTTGNAAWAILAMMRANEVFGDDDSLLLARALGDWIIANAWDERGDGGFTGGKMGFDAAPVSWKSTEHSIDCVSAFRRLHERTGDDRYREAEEHARKFVESMWDPSGHYKLGTLEDGVTPNEQASVLDVNAWHVLSLGPGEHDEIAMAWVDTNLAVEEAVGGVTYACLDFDHEDLDGCWPEGMAQAALAHRALGHTERSAELLETLRTIQEKAPRANGRGLVAALHDGLSTGVDFVYNNRLAVAPTSWLVFNERRFNPFTGQKLD